MPQSANAQSPISITPSGIVYSVSVSGANEFRTPLTIKHRPSSDANLPLNSASQKPHLNAPCPKTVTLLGIIMDLSPEQPNAPAPIAVTLLGIATLVRLL
jgi:hypothetical protein